MNKMSQHAGYTHLPKDWREAIRVQDGPHSGVLAAPCLCGHPFEDEDEVVFVEWVNGTFMVCHIGCVHLPERPEF